MEPRRNKTDAMPLFDDSDKPSSGGIPAGSEPVRPENPDPENPGEAGGAHDPTRDDAVDGEELMVPRVPNLLPETCARQIAEHELTGHAVYRSWCRHCVESKCRAHAHSAREERELPENGMDYGFFGRDGEDVLQILCVKCRNNSTACLGATVVDRKGASDYASLFLMACIKSMEFKRILVRSDNERSLLSLIERVTSNLTGVELVLMTSPEGDHAANNGLAQVGVREIKGQTRILRSQLEQRLGNRNDEEDPLMSWIPRHAAKCVSRYRLMDDGRTPDQRRCGKTWKRPVVEFGESVHFTNQLVRPVRCQAETRECCAASTWNITRDLVPRFFSRQTVQREERELRECWSTRDGIACSLQHVLEFLGN